MKIEYWIFYLTEFTTPIYCCDVVDALTSFFLLFHFLLQQDFQLVILLLFVMVCFILEELSERQSQCNVSVARLGERYGPHLSGSWGACTHTGRQEWTEVMPRDCRGDLNQSALPEVIKVPLGADENKYKALNLDWWDRDTRVHRKKGRSWVICFSITCKSCKFFFLLKGTFIIYISKAKIHKVYT